MHECVLGQERFYFLSRSYSGLDCKVYMVKVSYEQKPFRREVMRTYGASVTPSPRWWPTRSSTMAR